MCGIEHIANNLPAPAMLASLGGALSKLILCFGVVGTASVAVWLLVWAGMTGWSFRTRRMPACLAGSFLVALVLVYGLMVPHAGEVLAIGVWVAIAAAVAVVIAWAIRNRELPMPFLLLLLALAALGLGRWNSANVSMIREDRSAEIAAARQRQIDAQRAEAGKLRSKAAEIHFAEDDANDAVDRAGYTEQELNRIDAGAATPAEPEYRKRGKTRRDPNQLDANTPGLDIVTESEEDETPRYRYLPGADYMLANQLDLVNRFMLWLTLVTALLMAAAEYLRRFSQTFGRILPLPIASRTVDAIWPKTHSVLLHAGDTETGTAGETDDAQAGAVAAYLRTVVRKGESFILLASRDPWPTRTHLGRLPVFKWLWPMRKIAGRADSNACAPAIVFESAWYGRLSAVLLADGYEGPAADTLAKIMDMLRMRLRTRAKARRTVHLAWMLPDAPPAEIVEGLVFLCRETNVKFLAVARDPACWPEEAFEETANA